MTVEVLEWKTQLKHQQEEERDAQIKETVRQNRLKRRQEEKQLRQRSRQLNDDCDVYAQQEEEDDEEEDDDECDDEDVYDVHRNQTDPTKLRISLELRQVNDKDGILRPTYRQDNDLPDEPERQPKQQQAAYSNSRPRRAAINSHRYYS